MITAYILSFPRPIVTLLGERSAGGDGEVFLPASSHGGGKRVMEGELLFETGYIGFGGHTTVYGIKKSGDCAI